jgi:CO/xanthine dehydrogenase Mo-binding subunit
MTDTATRPATRAPRIGESAPRPDGVPKVQGRFAFGSDLWADGMVWGATLRSPYASAVIRSIDIRAAVAMPGVHAVVTADDVPGSETYGLEVSDQPVFARDSVHYVGQPIAAVAAEHPETARQALAAIIVDYEVLTPLIDAEEALAKGEIFRSLPIRHGDPSVTGDVVVEGTYQVGMQDQAFMGPECGLAIPDHDGGGVELFISTQYLHVDRIQVAACLDLPEENVRLTLAGVGGAFGAREDVSLQVHCCLLALRIGRPVKMSYSRPESFVGHVHRHPAEMWYRHHALRDGTIVKAEARLLLDGGAYASSSLAVIANAACFAFGPYKVPNAVVEAHALRTNNPPCGAMRGFGAVQTCFAHEAQMDRLADALVMDRVELRLKNALATGDELITGQIITGTAPVAEVIRACADAPLPASADPDDNEMMSRPGGSGRTADARHVRRGIGFGVGFKNLLFSEGFDDYSTARCELIDGVATITCACAEVGQGFVTLVQQIAREVLGIDDVIVAPAETASIGSAGSTSASRQTWMSGGAVQLACEEVRAQVLDAAGGDENGIPEAMVGRSFTATYEHHHAPTTGLNADGQGNAHVSFAFAAHRAVVDVDPELGLMRVVDITTAQDVGRVLNPLQAVGQLEGGIAQGVGLAVMEELILRDGRILNPSFTDYLIPTALDMPTVTIAAFIEQPEPGAPFGAKGIGEPPTISSTAAVAAAVRDATGLALTRVPIRPQDIAFGTPEPVGRPS